jgi:hypothetical protein
MNECAVNSPSVCLGVYFLFSLYIKNGSYPQLLVYSHFPQSIILMHGSADDLSPKFYMPTSAASLVIVIRQQCKENIGYAQFVTLRSTQVSP